MLKLEVCNRNTYYSAAYLYFKPMQLGAKTLLPTGRQKQTFQQGSTTCSRGGCYPWWWVSIFSGNCSASGSGSASCHAMSPHAIGVVSSSSANYLPLIRSTIYSGIGNKEYGIRSIEYNLRNGQHVTSSVAALAIVWICIPRMKEGGMTLTCSWTQLRSTH